MVNDGSGVKLSPRALAVLDAIGASGGMVCTGSCHHQKKEHLHCRQIGKNLDMGFATVWNLVDELLREGLLERVRDPDGSTRFTVVLDGKDRRGESR